MSAMWEFRIWVLDFQENTHTTPGDGLILFFNGDQLMITMTLAVCGLQNIFFCQKQE